MEVGFSWIRCRLINVKAAELGIFILKILGTWGSLTMSLSMKCVWEVKVFGGSKNQPWHGFEVDICRKSGVFVPNLKVSHKVSYYPMLSRWGFVLKKWGCHYEEKRQLWGTEGICKLKTHQCMSFECTYIHGRDASMYIQRHTHIYIYTMETLKS